MVAFQRTYRFHAILVLTTAFVLLSCDRWDQARLSPWQLTPIPCAPARTSESIPLRAWSSTVTVTTTFDELRTRIDQRCQQCHLSTRTGGFQYTDGYSGT